MQVQDDEQLYDNINITPMLDLAYVLLVIFIIMTTAAVQGIKVDLPKASQAKPLSQPKTKVIAIDSNGQISLDAVPVSMSELEQQLRNAQANNADLPVILRGDRAVQYEKVMAVLDLCSKLNISSIGLVSQKPNSGG